MFPVVSLKQREGLKGYNSLAKETEVEGISFRLLKRNRKLRVSPRNELENRQSTNEGSDLKGTPPVSINDRSFVFGILALTRFPLTRSFSFFLSFSSFFLLERDRKEEKKNKKESIQTGKDEIRRVGNSNESRSNWTEISKRTEGRGNSADWNRAEPGPRFTTDYSFSKSVAKAGREWELSDALNNIRIILYPGLWRAYSR